MEIAYDYPRLRKNFGRPTGHFSDRPAELLDDFKQESSLRGMYHEKNPTQLDLQSIPEMSEKESDTVRFEYSSVGVLHMEGGWPKDIDPTEKEHTARFKKKVEKDEGYIAEVRSMGDTLEHYIRQNNAIDIYEEYFDELQSMDYNQEPPAAKTLSVFKDPQEIKRSVTHISWFPDGGRKIAVSFAIMQFQDERMQNMSPSSYIWDVTNPNIPEQELLPQSPVCCLEYNTKDPHLLVGGCYNGMIAHWDTRKGSMPADVSKIELSHQDPVYDIVWLQGKTAYECCSVSTDGQVLWWDTRKLAEPTQILPLDKEDGAGKIGGVALEYSVGGGPTKFMVGTEQGMILSCNKRAKQPSERIGIVYSGHHGPVYSLQRNPFQPKYFMTIGDWTVRFWNEELRNPIMTSKYHRAYILDCGWSPTRPGVFFTTKMDGTLDIWDYLSKQNDPVLQIQVDEDGLQCMKIQEAGNIVATGSVDGSITMMQLSSSLSQIQPNEKNAVTGMFERETKREKNLETRAKEMKQKAMKEKSKAQSEETPEEMAKKKADAEAEAEQAFRDSIKKHEEKAAKGK